MSELKFFLKALFLYIPALLFVFIGSALLEHEFLDPHAGYRAFTAASARVGQKILIVAAIILVVDLVAIVTYLIRHGAKSDSEGSVVEAGPLPLSVGANFGRSKRKVLVQREDLISMKSLVRDTATTGERMLVLGYFVWLVSFFSIFLGIGLMLMKGLAILVLVPVIPGVFIYTNFVRDAWKDYKTAKAEFQGGPAATPHATDH